MGIRQLRQPHAALADLCDGFFDDITWVYDCPRMCEADLPEPQRTLLVHRDHMTERLEAWCGRPVELHVLAEEQDDAFYSRKILLTPAGSERPVELGIVRLNFAYIADDVRREILSREAPLGDILIRHGVLRRISPRWYFRFPAGSPVARQLAPGREVVGRVGTIYCDEEPAIDLLEIVSGEKPG